MTQKTFPKRGRPPKFDRNSVLQIAMQTFWELGYEGTSMIHLVDAMGIGSPSIYAAFGSKEQLFREVIELYIETEANSAWQSLENMPYLHQAIKQMLFTSIDSFVSTHPPRGCLIVLGVSPVGNASEPIASFLRDKRKIFRNRLAERIKVGIKNGDLHKDSDPKMLAECVLAVFIGLSLEAVDGTPKTTLRKAANFFCRQMFR